MAQTHKRLGQANPAAATATTLYTAPAATTTILSALTICNTGAASDSVRVCISTGGGTTVAAAGALMWELVIPPGNPFNANIVQDLNTGETLNVQSANGSCTFTLSGMELT